MISRVTNVCSFCAEIEYGNQPDKYDDQPGKKN